MILSVKVIMFEIYISSKTYRETLLFNPQFLHTRTIELSQDAHDSGLLPSP